MNSDILNTADRYFNRMVKLRRYFHANPEIAHQEFNTQKKIISELKQLKIQTKPLAETGVVGFLPGKNKRKVCAVRSDMDALPILEKTDIPFKSKVDGVMHACGHDVHMATVLGAAMILSAYRDELKGGVKFIFQPAEEVPPGGAIEMIRAGVMKNPAVKMIFGVHTDPNIPVGKIGCREGVLMSEVLDFDLTVIGKGGHGARPHDTVDSVVVASQIISSLQTVVARKIDPVSQAVLTIGKIEGGTARNVISGEVSIIGTIRGTSSETVQKVKKALEKIIAGVTSSFGAKYRLDYVAQYPVLYNHPKANNIISETAFELWGKNSVVSLKNPALGGEDFARYLKYSPGAMFRLGIKNRKIGAIHQWHSDKYTVDEDSMRYGSAVLAGAVMKFLNSNYK